MQTNKFSAAVGLKPTPPGNNSTDPRDRHACGHLKGRGGLPHGGVVAISVGSLGARLAVARSTATAASQSTTHQSAAHYSWRQRLTSCLAAARSSAASASRQAASHSATSRWLARRRLDRSALAVSHSAAVPSVHDGVVSTGAAVSLSAAARSASASRSMAPHLATSCTAAARSAAARTSSGVVVLMDGVSTR